MSSCTQKPDEASSPAGNKPQGNAEATVVDNGTAAPQTVRFWGNYMEVFGPVYPRGASQIPGTDTFPLLRYQGQSDETRAAEVRQAQAYGLDGFEVWPTFAAAERWIDALDRMGVDPDFEIKPQVAASGFYPTYEDLKVAVKDYLVRYGDNPRIARSHGKPLISSWGYLPYYEDFSRLRQELASEGLTFFWVPTTTRDFPVGLSYEAFDGVNSWSVDLDPEGIASSQRNAAKAGDEFEVVGTIRAGYDNGQRIFTQDYVPYRGMRTLLDSLNAGLTQGLTEMVLVTWNDLSETASYPSWASPYGYQEIIRYYRSLYAQEASVNEAAQVVVAYHPELLLGDRFEMQFVVLPGYGADEEAWSGEVRLEDSAGQVRWRQAVSLSGVVGEAPEVVAVEYAPDLDADIPVALSPVIVDAQGVQKRLPPVNVRVGRIRTNRPLTIALDKVAAPEVEIKVEPLDLSGVATPPVRLSYDVEAASPVAQMQVMDGVLVLEDIREADGGDDLYLGLDNWGLDETVSLRLKGLAHWRWLYHTSQDPAVTLAKSAAVGSDGSAQAWKDSVTEGQGDEITVPIAVKKAVAVRRDTPAAVLAFTTGDITGTTVEVVSSELADGDEHTIPLPSLFAGDVILPGQQADTSLRVRLMEDGHVLNRMPEPMGKHVAGSVVLPAVQSNEPYRVLSLSGQLADGSVFFSRPYVWVRADESAREQRKVVQVVQTGKPYDELAATSVMEITQDVSGYEKAFPKHTLAPHQPYAPEQIREVELPVWRLMSVDFPMDEGIGWLVGGSGSYMSTGWGWRSGVMDRPAKKWVGPGAEDSQWVIDEELERPVLHFTRTSRLSIRSRSGLAGSYTLDFDIKLDELGRTQRIVSDTDIGGNKGPLQMIVLPDGRIKVERDVTRDDPYRVLSTDRLTAGRWHHVRLSYDLESLSLEIDGKPAGTANVPPEIVRSHSTPYIGAVSPEKADGFAGSMANFIWQSGAGSKE
ncbi:MAG: LamG-like jellyroll fold domain-containing protein [Verrucomicrobiota bacterium JB024]|nr:LamG-like jellyroll fold domain-containing protein [Verrucomicrobiota bacterium JB024]